MRNELRNIGSNERYTFSALFVRFGMKNGYVGPIETVLLSNVCDEAGNLITDHLWFNKTKGFAKLDLIKDDIVSFNARVSSYQKGYKGYNFEKRLNCPIENDYKLSYPTHIQILKRGHDYEYKNQSN